MRPGLDVSYEKHREAYHKIFGRMGLRFMIVGADVGMMGGSKSEEFMAFSPNGEDTILVCPNCDYAANREVARFAREKAEPQDAPADGRGRDAEHADHREPRQIPRHRDEPDRQGRLLRRRIRQVHLRGDPGRSRYQRDEAATPRRRVRYRPGHGRADQGPWRGAGLRLAGRRAGRGDRRRREHPGRRELRGRREQAGLPPEECQSRSRLTRQRSWATSRRRRPGCPARFAALR